MDFNYFDSLVEHLQPIEVLDIVFWLLEGPPKISGNSIHLKRVTTFKIELIEHMFHGEIFTLQKIPITFSQLKEFMFTRGPFSHRHNCFLTFINENRLIENLFVDGLLVFGWFLTDKLQERFPFLKVIFFRYDILERYLYPWKIT